MRVWLVHNGVKETNDWSSLFESDAMRRNDAMQGLDAVPKYGIINDSMSSFGAPYSTFTERETRRFSTCLLYTSDAADE